MKSRAPALLGPFLGSLLLACGAQPPREPACPTPPAAAPTASASAARCTPEAFEACVAACDGGDAIACGHVGASFAHGDGRAIDAVAARTALERACTKGDGVSCLQRARLAGRADAADPAEPWLGRACDRSVADACFALSLTLPENGADAAERIRKALDRACAGAHAEACASLALRADTASKDVLGLLERACAGKSVRGCARLGERLEREGDGAADPKRARVVLALACDGGESTACATLGRLLLSTRGGERNAADARARLERACADDVDGACVSLAALLAAGDGGGKEAVRALALYDAACRDGDATACEAAADMATRGDGVKKDLVAAADYKRRACLAQGGKSCGNAPPAGAAAPTREALAAQRLSSLEARCGDILKKKLSKAMSLKDALHALAEVLRQARVEVEIVSGGSPVKFQELWKHTKVKCGG